MQVSWHDLLVTRLRETARVRRSQIVEVVNREWVKLLIGYIDINRELGLVRLKLRPITARPHWAVVMAIVALTRSLSKSLPQLLRGILEAAPNTDELWHEKVGDLKNNGFTWMQRAEALV